MNTANNLTIKNLSKRFYLKDNSILALNNINLCAKAGEIICLIGHNGAGKTTLIKSICGLLNIDQGDIFINQTNIKNNLSYAHNKCSVVLEGSRNIYYYLTVKENIKYFGFLNHLNEKIIDEKMAYYLKLFNLENFKDTVASKLSRGMQQKLAIIIALIKDPAILLLDEPTLGLDIISSDSMIDSIKKMSMENKIILITTHDINLIEKLNSRSIFMKQGSIVKDTLLSKLKKANYSKSYKVIIKVDQNQLPNEFITISESDEIIEIVTSDSHWISKMLEENKLLYIEQQQNSFSDIYKEIMEETK